MRTLGGQPNRTVGLVSHPAIDAEAACLLDNEVPKSYALHASHHVCFQSLAHAANNPRDWVHFRKPLTSCSNESRTNRTS